MQLVGAGLGEVDAGGARVVEHAGDVGEVFGRRTGSGRGYALDELERDGGLGAEGGAVVRAGTLNVRSDQPV